MTQEHDVKTEIHRINFIPLTEKTNIWQQAVLFLYQQVLQNPHMDQWIIYLPSMSLEPLWQQAWHTIKKSEKNIQNMLINIEYSVQTPGSILCEEVTEKTLSQEQHGIWLSYFINQVQQNITHTQDTPFSSHLISIWQHWVQKIKNEHHQFFHPYQHMTSSFYSPHLPLLDQKYIEHTKSLELCFQIISLWNDFLKNNNYIDPMVYATQKLSTETLGWGRNRNTGYLALGFNTMWTFPLLKWLLDFAKNVNCWLLCEENISNHIDNQSRMIAEDDFIKTLFYSRNNFEIPISFSEHWTKKIIQSLVEYTQPYSEPCVRMFSFASHKIEIYHCIQWLKDNHLTTLLNQNTQSCHCLIITPHPNDFINLLKTHETQLYQVSYSSNRIFYERDPFAQWILSFIEEQKNQQPHQGWDHFDSQYKEKAQEIYDQYKNNTDLQQMILLLFSLNTSCDTWLEWLEKIFKNYAELNVSEDFLYHNVIQAIKKRTENHQTPEKPFWILHPTQMHHLLHPNILCLMDSHQQDYHPSINEVDIFCDTWLEDLWIKMRRWSYVDRLNYCDKTIYSYFSRIADPIRCVWMSRCDHVNTNSIWKRFLALNLGVEKKITIKSVPHLKTTLPIEEKILKNTPIKSISTLTMLLKFYDAPLKWHIKNELNINTHTPQEILESKSAALSDMTRFFDSWSVNYIKACLFQNKILHIDSAITINGLFLSYAQNICHVLEKVLILMENKTLSNNYEIKNITISQDHTIDETIDVLIQDKNEGEKNIIHLIQFPLEQMDIWVGIICSHINILNINILIYRNFSLEVFNIDKKDFARCQKKKDNFIEKCIDNNLCGDIKTFF